MPDEVKIFRKMAYNIFDFIAVLLAYIVGYSFRFSQFNFLKDKYYLLTYVLIALFWVIVAINLSKGVELPTLSYRLVLLNILKRALLMFLYISCINFIAKLNLSRIFIFVFISAYIAIAFVENVILARIERFSFKNTIYHPVVIGTEKAIEKIKGNINKLWGNVGVNIKTIEIKENQQDSLERAIENLCEHIKNSIVDEVVILANFKNPDGFMKKIIEICKVSGRKLKILYEDQLGFEDAKVMVIDKNLIFEFKPFVISHSYKILKRLLDIVISLVALVITAPLFLLIAILIKIDSPDGPVFFVQERVGLNGRRFKLIKFRTMIPNADKMKDQLMKYNEMDGPVFKITNDPRITRVGKILRRLNLDELPQLINVLKGEMSLVGPRPLETREALGCEFEHHIRHSVKPGLTCIWQTTHNRNDVGYNEWMKMDYEYIMRKNIVLDIYLILRTLISVLKLNGK
ncbi:MAG: exopolysaccharide biosynthesis polyprenyl glycosylphosphotransferase [Candidatus Aenigmatarchaeota archaeon]